VNEEYEEAWATAARNFRFGNTTNSYPYRYFTSTLRALQMRCTYIHTTGHLIPQMLPFLSQELGRTVEDAPDVWTFLRTSYLRASNYQNNDYLNRTISATEKAEGIETKNFERWLYQRDAPGYETQPAVKIQQAIKMWMVQDNKYYDYIARSGKKIGFDIDDRWTGTQDSIALKITYFDNYSGEINLVYNNGQKQVLKSQQLTGDSQLKTVTFFLSQIKSNSIEHNFDFVLEAGENTDSIVVSMVRVINADVASEPVGTHQIPQFNDSNINITYNSAHKQITIKSTTELKQINVYNISGKKVKSLQCCGNTSNIQTNGFNPGIYLVNASDINGNMKRDKILIG
jgi:hypothetical protein